MRSARRIASPTSWVTSTVVTARPATRAGKLALQRQRQRPVERNERLVEQEERRADGEGARQRDAPRKAERQFAGKMRAMVQKSEQLQERFEIAPADLWRSEADVVLDAAPRQEPGLLEDKR